MTQEDIKAKLEKAAEYIITTSARETTSGNYITHPDDIPAEIITADLYEKHLSDIVEIMLEYDAVAEADIGADGSIDTLMFLSYCPNYIPLAGEEDEYPDDRIIPDPLTTRQGNDGHELTAVAKEETELFYSSQNPERDRDIGCIGHFRADFGRSGNEFWNSWEDHSRGLKTQDFKTEFKGVIDSLRDSGILKSRAAMSAYCGKHPEAKLTDGRDADYGFKIKTGSNIYYLRCNPSPNEYNFYCYAYERARLEKSVPAITPAKPTLMERLEAGKRKAAERGKTDNAAQKAKNGRNGHEH